MHEQFPVDLKVARRKSGLSQADCAHLLGVDPSVMSKFESGKAVPSVTQLTLLYVVLGEGARSLWSGLVKSLHEDLAQRLASMPKCPCQLARPVQPAEDPRYPGRTISHRSDTGA